MLLAAHCHCMTYAPRAHVQLPKLQKAGARFARDLIYYQPTAGRPELRAALASHMSACLCGGAYELRPEHLLVGAGCNAMLENLLFAIADPGQVRAHMRIVMHASARPLRQPRDSASGPGTVSVSFSQ